MNKADIHKAQTLLLDLETLEDMKTRVTVDTIPSGLKVSVNIPFTSAKVAQKVATILAATLNGSKDMNNLRKEIKAEVKDILADKVSGE